MDIVDYRIRIVRIAARVLSILLFLLWGSFFVEHLSWFKTSTTYELPAKVWFLSCMHLLLLIGYLTTFRWEKIGSTVIALSAVVFFSFAAGKNSVPFIIVSIFPILLYSYCWMKTKKLTPPHAG